MTSMYQWAIKWGVPFDAIKDYERMVGTGTESPGVAAEGASEGAVQNAVRLEAAQKGYRVFRNNVGALLDTTGRPVRFGLANDSKGMNEIIKSGDLIGIRPVLITEAHFGTIIGQFVSREIKESGWRYSATPREQAQQTWAHLINSMGGDAQFAAGVGTL